MFFYGSFLWLYGFAALIVVLFFLNGKEQYTHIIIIATKPSFSYFFQKKTQLNSLLHAFERANKNSNYFTKNRTFAHL